MNVARIALVLLFLLACVHAEFILNKVSVEAYSLQDDGTAHIKERITLFVRGDYERQLYLSGFNTNDLSFWATQTGIREIKPHINLNKVELVDDLTITPQPLRSCNPGLNQCHGEIVIEYTVGPQYNGTTQVPNTGLFLVDHYKPRTTRYFLNTNALAFTTTEQDDILLGRETNFTIYLPPRTVLSSIQINPLPEKGIPKGVAFLSWTDTILVNFKVLFDTEETLDEEIAYFFRANIFGLFQGSQAPFLISIIIILVGSYVYLSSEVAKKKR